MSESKPSQRPNKTQLKREIRRLNLLGQALTSLSPTQLDTMPLDDSLRAAIIEAKRLQKGALQRQYRRIASLIKQSDVAEIEQAFERLKLPNKQETQRLHTLEKWRERLLLGDQELLTQLLTQYPNLDGQRIRQLVRNAASERQANKPAKSFRALFKHLSDNIQIVSN